MQRIIRFVLLSLLLNSVCLAGTHETELHRINLLFYQCKELGTYASDIASDLRANKISTAEAKAKWQSIVSKAEALRDSAPAELERSWTPGERRLKGLSRPLERVLSLQVERLQGLVSAAQVELEEGVSGSSKAWEKQRQKAVTYLEAESALQKLIKEKYYSPLGSPVGWE